VRLGRIVERGRRGESKSTLSVVALRKKYHIYQPSCLPAQERSEEPTDLDVRQRSPRLRDVEPRGMRPPSFLATRTDLNLPTGGSRDGHYRYRRRRGIRSSIGDGAKEREEGRGGGADRTSGEDGGAC
jgi:hypothetical protein